MHCVSHTALNKKQMNSVSLFQRTETRSSMIYDANMTGSVHDNTLESSSMANKSSKKYQMNNKFNVHTKKRTKSATNNSKLIDSSKVIMQPVGHILRACIQ